ncbi:MAG: serine/threonine-protein kinase [Solirubrobacteraceae bacterium]
MPESPAILRPGEVLGAYRVGDVLGIGGMAIVYRAEQISLGRPVALKVLSARFGDDVMFRERFRREAQQAAALEHPNIVPIYDFGEIDGLLYLAMRLIDGSDLAELIRTRGLSADETVELLRPIASALDAAHAAGLVHRDVRPQNILITAQGHPYLSDLGVARGSETAGLTRTGGFVGSVQYAAPEQISGLPLTGATDVYALTAVLYQCLTGDVPYPHDTEAGVMHAHLSEPPPSLPGIDGPGVGLNGVIVRGMAKDPAYRCAHATELIDDAAASISQLPSRQRTAVPPFPVERDEAAGPAVEAAAAPRGDTPPSPQTAGAQPVAVAPGDAPGPSGEPYSAGGPPTGGHVETLPHGLTTADPRRAAPPQPQPPGSHPNTLRIALTALLATALIAVIAVAAIVILPGSGLFSSSSSGQTFSGSGNKHIRVIRVHALSTLRWTCPGCGQFSYFAMNSRPSNGTGPFLDVLGGPGQKSGATVIDGGTYTNAAIDSSGKWSFTIAPGNSTQTNAQSQSPSGTRTFTGSEQEDIGTIKVPVASTLRWSCSGCAGGPFFSVNNNAGDKQQLDVNGAASGASALNPATYTDVTGNGIGPWKLTITPGDSMPGASSSAAPQTFSGSGDETLGTVNIPVASTLTWSCATCAGFWLTSTPRLTWLNVFTTGGTSGTAIVNAGTYPGTATQDVLGSHWSITITPGFTAGTP